MPSAADPLLTPRPRPELLAPAGDADCARAAVENGADAVYFGLRTGLNARARAINFSPEELIELMAYLHLRGVKGYVTLNTLVFPGEWGQFEAAVRQAISAGVDAALVQDLGAARLARAVCPDWPLHASTQMSLTSAEGIDVAESLGIARVVLARELALDDIRQIRGATRVELEVFVHGALCLSYSGQCLASLSMGGRSGNRGQCAQPCRLPYDVITVGRVPNLPLRGGPGSCGRLRTCPMVDGELKTRPTKQYPLSPNDLAALDLVPELLAAGVDALKIEGRLKSAEYVAAVTRQYRRAIDEALAGRRLHLTPQEIEELEVSFSRGFSHGWLEGRNPDLVPGHGSAKRGLLVGAVRAVAHGRVTVELAGSIKRGDGVVFEGDRSEGDEQGGRVYGVYPAAARAGKASPSGEGHFDNLSCEGAVSEGVVELTFANESIDFGKLRPGQKVWKTDDPQVTRRLRRTFASARPQRRVPLDLAIQAAVGSRLRISAVAGSGARCQVQSSEALLEAVKHPLTMEVLREQLGRLGSTVYELRGVEAQIDSRPMVPLSVLGRLRREMVERLDAAAVGRQSRRLAAVSPLASLSPTRPRCLQGVHSRGGEVAHVLCRSLDQLESVLALGAASAIAELSSLDECADAVGRARERGAEILLATPRIQKPGEMEVLHRLLDCRPSGMLVRNLAGAAFCASRGMPFVADFSLNAANELTVAWLHDLGAQRVTAAYDLGREQLLDLALLVEPEWLEVIVYAHVPMFHTEHCVLAGQVPDVGQVSNFPNAAGQVSDFPRTAPAASGKLRTRPASATCPTCRLHEARLRDRRGAEHPLRADMCCRNTLYHAEPRSLAALVPELRARGVRHFRIELLEGVPQKEIQRAIAAM